MAMPTSKRILSIVVYCLHFLLQNVASQQSTNGCSTYLRNVHRMGPNLSGRLEIPVDEQFPKYKLKIEFSSPIHHMAIRQSRAKDTGTHKVFIVDPMEMQRDGKLQLDVFIRLQSLFSHAPRMTRIVYNNNALCGDPVGPTEIDESFLGGFTTSAPPRRTTFPVLIPFNNTLPSKIKDYGEEEEDIF